MKKRVAEETKLEILNNHYNETVSGFTKLSKSRDRSFVILLILLGVMSFQLFSPDQSESVLTQFAQKKLEVDATPSIAYIGSLIWFSVLAVAVRYFQSVINIEKQYNYSHKLEVILSKYYSDEAFTKEGKSYLKDYPIFSDWINFVYRSTFPVLFVVAITVKIVSEWSISSFYELSLLFDSAIYVMLIITTALYIFSLRKMNKDDEKDT